MTQQKYSSKATSINGKGKRLPAVFKKMSLIYKSINLDYGGGESEVVQEFFDREHTGIKNFVMDKYNRSEEHNNSVREELMRIGGADTCTISNVLNVIAEEEVRQEVLKEAFSLVKNGGWLYITVYEGDKTGVGRETKKDCWQNNKRLKEYREEVVKALGQENIWLKVGNGMISVHKEVR